MEHQRASIHPPRRLVPRLRPSRREGEIHGVQTRLKRETEWSNQRTDFRIDLPTRSGHIEGDGRCRGRGPPSRAVRSPVTMEPFAASCSGM